MAPSAAYFMRLLLDTLRLHLAVDMYKLDSSEVTSYYELMQGDSIFTSLRF